METKRLSFSDAEVKFDEAGLFAGYASVFGGVDSYGDTIIKGAYESTLRANGKPKMFFNHDSQQMPIGKWVKAKEDDKGLYVEGELTKGNAIAEQVLAGLKHGTIDGLSIGYGLKKGDFEDTESGRIIRKVSRLAEVSIVTFPADGAARVDLASVKSEDIEELETVRDLERFLRDAGGLSKAMATMFVSRARSVFEVGGTDNKKQAEMAALFQRLAELNQKLKV